MSQICDNHIHFNIAFANLTNFLSLEVVDRVSDTQLQVTKHLIILAQEIDGHSCHAITQTFNSEEHAIEYDMD